VASRAGHIDVIRVLAEFGANLGAQNLSGGTASKLGRNTGFGSNRNVLKSSTPLSKAAHAGKFEAVKVLIELGASLPARDAMSEASLK
jgi:ankyrin repeat protein